MATITRDGKIEDAGESLGEFQARQQAKRIKERGLSKTEQRQASSGGFTQQDYIDFYESKTAEASKQQAELNVKLNKDPLIQAQPKGSVRVTQADGSVVFRTTGVNAQGRYVQDVYERIREENIIQSGQSQYTTIPRSAKRIRTAEGGTVFRNVIRSKDKTIVTDFKPGGIAETKVIRKTFLGGSSFFIPKKSKSDPNFLLPPSPALDFASKIKAKVGDPFPKTASTGLIQYAETLKEREARLQGLKDTTFNFLHIKGKENAKFYNVFEIAKGLARVPFEIASIPSFIYGRANLTVRSLFDPAGRKILTQGVKDTPSAVREVFVHRDATTGKYQFTAQNVVNVGVTALAVRSVAKSPSNVGLKVYEKYAKTDIKGSIQGFQKTIVFKSKGILKGRPYRELTVFKGKGSTSTIQYQGKTYIIKRSAGGKGTYKIIQTKTKLNLPSFKGKKTITLKEQKAFLTKEAVVLKKGSFKPGGKPIKFKAEKGITTQDIRFLDQRALSHSYINYLEQLKVRAKAQGNIKSGSQNLKFDAKVKTKVKSDLSGVVSHQKIRFNEIDYQSGTIKITDKFVKPKIQFAEKPVRQPDVFVDKFIKDATGKAIIGYKKGIVAQPRHIIKGTQDVIIKGDFTIKGGQGFGVFKNPITAIKNLVKYKNVIKASKIKNAPKLPGPKKIKPVNFKPGAKDLIDSSKIPKSIYKSKPAPLGDQIALTEQIQSELVYNVPFKSKPQSIKYSTLNFDVLSSPLGKVKPFPLAPTVKGDVALSTTTPTQQLKPLFTKLQPVFSVKTFQEVRPVSVIDQIKNQKSIADIKVGQKGASKSIQQPKSVIAQVQAQAQISEQITSQKQVAKQQSKFQNIFNKVNLAQGFAQAQIQKIIIPKAFVFPKLNFSGGSKPSGFNVFTRIKGVFQKANIKPLSEQDAINFGAFKVQTTSQATFKIGKTTEQIGGIFTTPANLQDFYKKDDLFIEKKERRIKSPGELREITYKGIATRRNKSIFKNIFGG